VVEETAMVTLISDVVAVLVVGEVVVPVEVATDDPGLRTPVVSSALTPVVPVVALG
jgi:hypothetical protein